MSSSKSIAVLFNQAPFAHSSAQEGIDLALVSAAFGVETALFFSGDGVFLLRQGLNAPLLQQKPFTDVLSGLALYEIEQLYVEESALMSRGLQMDDLLPGCQCLTSDTFYQTLRQHTHIVCF